ncbi:hypothetical protein DYQ86_16045 [Acidobacteria bacterium AB60]|nr:hypothetical protein DYQ86_16045 [Acidobacteria bacterium AB60]
MPNTSATGGFLAPSSINGDLNDNALIDFLQTVVVGITGLPGNMVRPRWQPEPPNIPDAGANWAAIGPGSIKRDPFAGVIHQSAGQGDDLLVRTRTVDVMCSFYGPAAQANAELLANGLEIAQNREAMRAQGYQLIGGAGDSVTVPTLVKTTFYWRVDISFTVRQQQEYVYPVLNVMGATGTVATDTSPAVSDTLTVNPPA